MSVIFNQANDHSIDQFIALKRFQIIRLQFQYFPMISAFLLHLFFILLICECSALRDGFIYSKEVPLSQEIKHFSFKDSESLVIQHPQEIVIANIDRPNQIVQKIAEKDIQTIPFSVGQTQKQIFFISDNFLVSEKGNSSFSMPIDQITDLTPIIQADGIIYFFNPNASKKVLFYNLKKRQIRQGPDLSYSHKYGKPKAIAFNSKLRHLFIGLESGVYVINMINQLVFQELKAFQPLHEIIVNQSQNTLFIIDNNERSTFYKFDQTLKLYEKYYITSLTNGPEKSGLYFSQSQDKCHEISTIMDSSTSYSMRIAQSPCLQIKSIVVDQIPGVSNLDIFRLGKDKQHAYSVKVSYSPKRIYKYLIKKDELQEIQSKGFELPYSYSTQMTFEISPTEIIVLKNPGNRLVLWDYRNEEKLFANAIQNFDLSFHEIRLTQFHPNIAQLYLCYSIRDEPETKSANQLISTQFCWLQLDNPLSMIKCSSFKNQIKQIIFANRKIYLLFHNLQDIIIILDQTSKEIIDSRIIPGISDFAVVKGELFAIINSNYVNKLTKFNSEFEEIMSIQVLCSIFYIKLRHTDSQLIAICYEQEHAYNTDLEYIGSTISLTSQITAANTKQAALSYMRFNQDIGTLIRHFYQPWKISIIRNISQPLSLSSNYLLLNPTDFIIYHHNGPAILIHHCHIINNKVQIIKQLKIGDSKTDIFFESCLKLDCSKNNLIVSYLNYNSQLSQDTLIYSLDKFQLLYYYRDADHSTAGQYQIPYVNCDGQLFSTFSKGLKIFQIASKSSVNIKEFTKDLAISSTFDGLSCLVFGTTGQKKSISLWSSGDQQMIQLFNSISFSVVNKIFHIGKTTAVLSINQLYFSSKNIFTKFSKAISDCLYYSATQIICLTTDSQLYIFEQGQEPVPSSAKIEGKYNSMSISQDKSFLILANQGYIKILHWVKSSNLYEDFQTISCIQCHLKQTLIASHGNQILSYSSKNNSMHYWKLAHCPPLSQIRDGFCRCISVQSNNQCFCREGEFVDEQSCSPCSFFCDVCSDSSSSCDSFSKTGIAILTSIVWIGVFGVVVILICLRNRMRKRKENSSASIQSQLISQDGTIND